MRFTVKFILQIITNALAIGIAVYFLPQYISFTGDWQDYLMVGAILTVANLIVRPILKIISTPLIFITLGLFTIVINIIILFGVDWFVQELDIVGFWGYLIVSVIVSILNAIIVGAAKQKPQILNPKSYG